MSSIKGRTKENQTTLFWYAWLTQTTPKGAQNSWHIKKRGECNHLHKWWCDWQLGSDIRAESTVELFTETGIKDWRIGLFCSMRSFVTASDSAQPLQFSAFVTQAHWERGQWAGTAVELQPGPLGWPLSSHEGRLDISIQHLERQGKGENAAIQRLRPLSQTRRPIVWWAWDRRPSLGWFRFDCSHWIKGTVRLKI